MERTAPPLKRPADFASRMIPVARAPFGIATLPSTSTGAETVAEKFWPVVDVFEPIDSSKTTEIVASAGTTMGLVATASDLPEDELLEEASGEPLVEASDVADWSAGFWQPETANRKPRAKTDDSSA